MTGETLITPRTEGMAELVRSKQRRKETDKHRL
jgi:hypothetical protein